MIYKDTPVVSRVTNKVTMAKLVECECGHRNFMVYIIASHPHLQCCKCGTTYCQSPDCEGVGEMQIGGN